MSHHKYHRLHDSDGVS